VEEDWRTVMSCKSGWLALFLVSVALVVPLLLGSSPHAAAQEQPAEEPDAEEQAAAEAAA